MSRSLFAIPSCCLSLALVSCSGSSGGETAPAANARLLVTAGTNVIGAGGEVAPVIDLTALAADRVEAHYRLTTPADTPLQFELVAWAPLQSTLAEVAVNHLRDGDSEVPVGDPVSLARVGLVPGGQGLASDGEWTRAAGSGFARLTIQGRVTQGQLLAVRSEGRGIATVEIAIGERSEINRAEGVEPEPDVISRTTIYSSASWQFGRPTVAVSGDRTSVVVYEGDRARPDGEARFEQRLQHDAVSGAVTGGAEGLPVADPSYWRDHEIVALYNVLGVVRAEATGVRARLSFDRGASFAQDVQVLPGFTQSRVVQAAMATDYSLAIAAWREAAGGVLEFVLVEGRPQAFDAFGSPTWFAFQPAQVLFTSPEGASPLTTGIAWSQGGDLVVGYAYSTFGQNPTGPGWGSTTEFRCATRRYNEAIVDARVDLEQVFGIDPTVAVLGQGANLRIFYAYEVRDGLRLATSGDGVAWQAGAPFGNAGDYLPTVFARTIGADVRVDVLYLANRGPGTELHRSSWASWPLSPRVDEALTRAEMTPSLYSNPILGSPAGFGMRVKQVGFVGYDAVLDGDRIVVAYDEIEQDGWSLCFNMLTMTMAPTTMTAGWTLPPTFSHASPPPLAPGLTLPMPAPDASHMHQLKILRLQ
jgi:hypothetical protein